ncbi:MAG TPA: MFS transporter [Candidatus Bathyarchaeia archaeon]|nr:MFS transporter [Candidatus Bathyarchaeia archaeon]
MATVVETEKVSLRHHPDFLKLWLSETISQFGGQFSGFAIPLTAIFYLNANAAQLGYLGFTGFVGWPLFGLFVGVYVDRHHRQRIMVVANIFRGIFLASIPVVAVLGLLNFLGIVLLYLVSFAVGVLQVFFDVSYQAYLPSLVAREQLVEGNSKLEASRSSAQVVGPFSAGLVIAIITAPIAIAIDAGSFLTSASVLARIRIRESLPTPLTHPSVMHDIREGLAVIFNDKRLRSIAGSTGTANFFGTAWGTILLLYFATPPPGGLGVPRLQVGIVAGIIFSVASVGALAGVALAGPLSRRLGLGSAITLGMILGGVGGFAFYFAGPATVNPYFTVLGFAVTPSILLMIAGNFVTFIGVVVYNINQVSLRQAIVPIRLQGRMNASIRFLVWGTIPAGALAGGLLGTVLGLRPAIGITVIGGALAFLWVLFSPVRSMKTVPEPLE